MTGGKGGWRSLTALFRGREEEERPADVAEETASSTDRSALAKDDSPGKGTKEVAGRPKKAGEDGRIARGAEKAEGAAEEEPSPPEPSREEKLEEEIRTLRGEVKRLETELAEQTEARSRVEAELEALGDHDPLTGVSSARLFADRLSVAIVHAQRYDGKLAVVQLDRKSVV